MASETSDSTSSTDEAKQTQQPASKGYERYMFIVAVGGNLVFYLQAYQAFTTESAKDVSAPAFIASLWALSSWLIYGLMIRNKIIIVANIVGVAGAILVLLTKWLYG